jgi:hypothetical protein
MKKPLQYLTFLLPALITAVFLLLANASCRKQTGDPVNMGYTYFPLDIGNWVEYRVDSISWDGFFIPTKVDTAVYFIREVIESEIVDNQGRPSVRIERYWRHADTAVWEIKDVWMGIRTPATFELVEENDRFVKLSFPVRKSARWNGNAYNLNGEELYVYDEAHLPAAFGSFSFDSTTTVIEINQNNLIEKKISKAKYATNVGMYYRFRQFLNTQVDGSIKDGYQCTYSLINKSN